MLPNPAKSFEIDNGIVLCEGGPGLYGGTGSPIGLDTQMGSLYFDKDTANVWWKYGESINHWRQLFDASKNQGTDFNNLLVSGPTGVNITSAAYAVINQSPAGGQDFYLPNTGFTFVASASPASGGSVTVRLWDVNTMVELVSLEFLPGDPWVKSAGFTFPGGLTLVETQAKRTGGTGILYSSIIVSAG